jgi:hypothetical protein
MKEFFLILLFSEWVQLTPVPVDVTGELVLYPSEPISAITSGAALHVDLEAFLGGVSTKETGIAQSRQIFDKLIPPGSVYGLLIAEDGEQVLLDEAFLSLQDDKAWLVLRPNSGVPTGIEFEEVVIRSDIFLKEIVVFWKNHSM